MDSIVIISPHMDDEVYGCAHYLEYVGGNLIIIYCTAFHPLFLGGESVVENQALWERYHFKRYILESAPQTNCLEVRGHGYFVNEFERILFREGWKVHTVLIPAPSYNQDHRIIYDSALTAMRFHDRNPIVKRILVYEQTETLGTMRKPVPFHPNYFVRIDIKYKLELLDIYKSQLRGHRSKEQVEALARLRGMQSGLEYAEAYEILRWID